MQHSRRHSNADMPLQTKSHAIHQRHYSIANDLSTQDAYSRASNTNREDELNDKLRVDNLREKVSKHQKTINELMDERRDYLLRIQELETQLNAVEQRSAQQLKAAQIERRATHEYGDYQKRLEQLQDEVESEKMNVMKSFEDKLHYQNKVEVLDDELKAAQVTICEMTQQVDKLRTQNLSQTRQLESSAEEVEELRDELASYRDRADQIKVGGLQRLESLCSTGLSLLKDTVSQRVSHRELENRAHLASRKVNEAPLLADFLEVYDMLKEKVASQANKLEESELGQKALYDLKNEVEGITAMLRAKERQEDTRIEAKDRQLRNKLDQILEQNQSLKSQLAESRQSNGSERKLLTTILDSTETLMKQNKVLSQQINDTVSFHTPQDGSKNKDFNLLLQQVENLRRGQRELNEKLKEAHLSELSSNVQDISVAVSSLTPAVEEVVKMTLARTSPQRSSRDERDSIQFLTKDIQILLEKTHYICQKLEHQQHEPRAYKEPTEQHIDGLNDEISRLKQRLKHANKTIEQHSTEDPVSTNTGHIDEWRALVDKLRTSNQTLREKLDHLYLSNGIESLEGPKTMQEQYDLLRKTKETLHYSETIHKQYLSKAVKELGGIEKTTRLLEAYGNHAIPSERFIPFCNELLACVSNLEKEARELVEDDCDTRSELKELVFTKIFLTDSHQVHKDHQTPSNSFASTSERQAGLLDSKKLGSGSTKRMSSSFTRRKSQDPIGEGEHRPNASTQRSSPVHDSVTNPGHQSSQSYREVVAGRDWLVRHPNEVPSYKKSGAVKSPVSERMHTFKPKHSPEERTVERNDRKDDRENSTIEVPTSRIRKGSNQGQKLLKSKPTT